MNEIKLPQDNLPMAVVAQTLVGFKPALTEQFSKLQKVGGADGSITIVFYPDGSMVHLPTGAFNIQRFLAAARACILMGEQHLAGVMANQAQRVGAPGGNGQGRV